MKPCCFRANAETRQLNYHAPSWKTPSLEQPIEYFLKKIQFFLATGSKPEGRISKTLAAAPGGWPLSLTWVFTWEKLTDFQNA